MSKVRDFDKTALVIGILSSLEEERENLLSALRNEFGDILISTPAMPFPYTDYYDREMSRHPVRYFILFRNLINPQTLADIKIKTNSIEHLFENEAGRRINIDPGIMSLSNFILATGKDRSHRIPLQNGIYGEVTLIYQDHDYQRLPWTYADYASEEVKSILKSFRDSYRQLLRQEKNFSSNFQNEL